ncbi:MAG: SurA N-terminal domain-containing protein [Bacteroidota bacterium]
MSILSRIRNNMGLVVVVIAIATLGFILTDFLTGATRGPQGPRPVGEIAGRTITAADFEERYQAELQRYPSLPESQRGFIMDQVWNQMVSEILYEKEFEKHGIEISGDEVYDMFTGKNIHPAVRQSFTSPGQEFDPEFVRSQLSRLLDDETMAEQLIVFEDFLAKSRATERYNNMISSAYLGSKAQAQQKYNDQNRNVNGEYLAINYAQIPDSLVSVSDSELESYISSNKNRYKQVEETYVKFVNFPVEASEEDSARARNKVLGLKERFEDAPNDSVFTSNKSRTPYTGTFQAVSALSPELQDQLTDGSVGSILGPVFEAGYYKLYKIVDTQTGEETFSKVKHILIKPSGDDNAADSEARSRANQLARQANASNFFDLANENSRDFQTKTKGGSLGWLTAQNKYGEDFYDEVSKIPAGSIRTVKSDEGYHVVFVEARTNKEYALANIEEEVFAGSATDKGVFQEANIFLSKVSSANSIDSAAAALGQNAIQSNPFTPETRFVNGLEGGRELIRWGLEADLDELSEVMRIGDSYVVAEVVEKRSEGTRSLEDLRTEVNRKVLNQKKAQIIKDRLNGLALSDDLNAVSQAYNNEYSAGSFVNTATGINFETSTIPGIGADYYLIGKISSMSQGDVSSPLEGINGVYVFKATQVTEPVELESETLITKRTSESLTGKTAIEAKIDQTLKDISDIEDERYKAGY